MYQQKSDLQSTDVEVKKMTDKGNLIFVEDIKGDFYSFFKNLTSGLPSKAFQTMPLVKRGQPITIVWKSKEYLAKDGSGTKTLRSIVKFRIVENPNQIGANSGAYATPYAQPYTPQQRYAPAPNPGNTVQPFSPPMAPLQAPSQSQGSDTGYSSTDEINVADIPF